MAGGMRSVAVAALGVLGLVGPWAGAAELRVRTDFPGGNAQVLEIDPATRTIAIQPRPHPEGGWPCWWSFQLAGLRAGLEYTLRVSGDGFTRPERASLSEDGGRSWRQTGAGRTSDRTTAYTFTPAGVEIWLAWGPPFQLSEARAVFDRARKAGVGAEAFTLCRSRDGRDVPGLIWQPPREASRHRPGVWIQARQHAWESGSSWVAQGVIEFLISDTPPARRLRETACVVLVPIMDVDHVEQGAGGKDAKPHDHNRDWHDQPHWPEVAAAQKRLKALNAAGELDLFLDLHQPAPGDRTPFFFVPPEESMPAERRAPLERWLSVCAARLGQEPLGLEKSPRVSGANYDPRWQRISKNWAARHLDARVVPCTLEISWNTPRSTPESYRSYGQALGRAIADFLTPQPEPSRPATP